MVKHLVTYRAEPVKLSNSVVQYIKRTFSSVCKPTEKQMKRTFTIKIGQQHSMLVRFINSKREFILNKNVKK